MKSKADFDLYYEKELKPAVASLEEKRLNIANRFSYQRYKRNLKWLFGLDLIVGILVGSNLLPESFIAVIPLSVLYAIFAPLYIFIRRNLSFDPINKEYKQQVIPRIISFLDPNLKYTPTEGILLREFNQSNLFAAPTSFKSEDLVEGTVQGISLRVSDVQASRRYSSRNSSGKSSNEILLHGLYAIAKLDHKVPSQVIVKQTNVVSNALGQLARTLLGDAAIDAAREHLHMRLVKTGNEAFDNDFEVTCAEEAVAKRVLTPLFLNLILALKAEVKLQILLSAFDDQLHIAYQGVDLFEGDAHRSFVKDDLSRKYFQYLSSVIGMAQALQANH